MSAAPAKFTESRTPLEGLLLLTRHPLADSRGAFERMFCADELLAYGFVGGLQQVNRSLTRHKGVVRGMHFQYPPHAEIKLVSCVRGEVHDVAVDLRKNSPTYLQSFGCRLSAANHQSLLIPAGFAHGFQSISDECELLYCHNKAFRKEAEGGLHPRDPAISISWPLPISDLSPRDSAHPFISSDFNGVTP